MMLKISAGATLLKYSAEGKSIGIVDLTEGELGTRGSIELRHQEAKAAGEMLKLKARKNLNVGDGVFEISYENKVKVIELIRLYQPNIILANSGS